MISSSTLPSRGTKVVSIASTANVPEPCIGTVTKSSAPFRIAGKRVSTDLLILMKAASREPQSCTMACLTDFEVVSGPGVSSSGSPVSELATGGRWEGMGLFLVDPGDGLMTG